MSSDSCGGSSDCGASSDAGNGNGTGLGAFADSAPSTTGVFDGPGVSLSAEAIGGFGVSTFAGGGFAVDQNAVAGVQSTLAATAPGFNVQEAAAQAMAFAGPGGVLGALAGMVMGALSGVPGAAGVGNVFGGLLGAPALAAVGFAAEMLGQSVNNGVSISDIGNYGAADNGGRN